MISISKQLLHWHAEHGRHDLPWQNTKDAYRIWLSEIMLQQTQVTTVIPYYTRFLEHFPTIKDLAIAEQDQVLHLWTGLGYYARARNLHKAAKQVVSAYNSVFPTSYEDVLSLPGIGKSTAGAILAFSTGQRHPILDGNVKRVLARFYEVEGWYGVKAVENKLWELAELNTPKQDVGIYTQAIMDFGATLCKRSKPLCSQCPLASNCLALANGRTNELPHGKPKTTKPTKKTFMLLVMDTEDRFMLVKNPPSGIWGSLWCPPQSDTLEETHEIFDLEVQPLEQLPIYKHTFSHYHLEIIPVLARVSKQLNAVAEAETTWYCTKDPQNIGLAAPVKKLLQRYAPK